MSTIRKLIFTAMLWLPLAAMAAPYTIVWEATKFVVKDPDDAALKDPDDPSTDYDTDGKGVQAIITVILADDNCASACEIYFGDKDVLGDKIVTSGNLAFAGDWKDITLSGNLELTGAITNSIGLTIKGGLKATSIANNGHIEVGEGFAVETTGNVTNAANATLVIAGKGGGSVFGSLTVGGTFINNSAGPDPMYAPPGNKDKGVTVFGILAGNVTNAASAEIEIKNGGTVGKAGATITNAGIIITEESEIIGTVTNSGVLYASAITGNVTNSGTLGLYGLLDGNLTSSAGTVIFGEYGSVTGNKAFSGASAIEVIVDPSSISSGDVVLAGGASDVSRISFVDEDGDPVEWGVYAKGPDAAAAPIVKFGPVTGGTVAVKYGATTITNTTAGAKLVVPADETVVLTPTPSTGNVFNPASSWLEGAASATRDGLTNNYDLTVANSSPIVISAKFELPKYTITLKKLEGAGTSGFSVTVGSTTTPSSDADDVEVEEVEEGTKVNLAANVVGNFKFVKWILNGVDNTTNPLNDYEVTRDLVVEAVFAPTYAIAGVTDPVSGGGSVAFRTGGAAGTTVTRAAVGDVITVVATPEIGYKVTNIASTGADVVTVAYTSPGETATFTMVAGSDVEVTVTFAKIDYTLTKGATTPASVPFTTKVSGTEAVTAHYEDVVAVEVVESDIPDGYIFGKWEVKTAGGATVPLDAEEDLSTTFDMPAYNVTITPKFIRVYKVILASVANGSPSVTAPVDPTKVPEGADVAIATTVSTGYKFVRWTSTPVVSFTTRTASSGFKMPGSDITLTPVFEPTYDLTVTGGSGSANGLVASDVVEITADAPASGKYFDKWECKADDGSAITPYQAPTTAASSHAYIKVSSFDAGDEITCEATYDDLPSDTYLISVAVTGKGNVAGPKYAEEGATVTLTAVPFSSYVFKEWACTALDECSEPGFDETVSSLTFEMPEEAVSIAAEFEVKRFELAVIAAGSSAIKINGAAEAGDKTLVDAESEATVDVSFLTAGYTWGGWTKAPASLALEPDVETSAGATTTRSTLFEMPTSDVTLTATLTPKSYDITIGKVAADASNPADVACATAGSVSGAGTKAYNSSVNVKATAAGLCTVSLSATPSITSNIIGGSLASGDVTFSMLAQDVDFVATFAAGAPVPTYTITRSITGNGQITYKIGGGAATVLGATASVPENSVVEFEAAGLCGNTVTSLTVDGVTESTTPFTLSKTITADITVSAIFSNTACPVTPPPGGGSGGGVTPPSSTYSIVVTSGAGGTARADKSAASYQTRVTLSATPDEGYRFKRWISSTSIPNSFMATTSFEMPARAVSIQAEFELDNSYAVTVTSGAGGTAAASANTATYLAKVTLTATPSDGYRFKEWVVKSGDVVIASAKSANTEFAMPPRAVSIEATFEEGSSPIIARLTTSAGPVMAHAINGGILLQNLPQNAKVEVYSLQGKNVHSANTENSQTLKIQARSGMYIVKINGNAMRVAVK